ncbi:hypothetical protein ACEZDB_05390 [Streptacidiphilus sp. N1-3]|uniref:Uncharacterized protein n=1 Tax=Streptacidiphilus alkalitolerans TaxID=3342712 RepID=A0ABV6WVW1_9ACTN
MMGDSKVSIPLAEVIEAARDLNEYVVCFDRIFSRLATGDYSQEILADYLVDREVRQRIARLREQMFDALEASVGAEEAERIAEEAYFYEDPE